MPVERSDLDALEGCDRLLTLCRGEQVGSLAGAAGWEPCQSSMLGALPGQHVGSLARAAGLDPCQNSMLGALTGQYVIDALPEGAIL